MSEIKSLRNSILELQKRISELERYELMCHDYEEKLTLISNEYDQLAIEKQNLEQDLLIWKQKYEEIQDLPDRVEELLADIVIF